MARLIPLFAMRAAGKAFFALLLFLSAPAAQSHEVLPSIADMTLVDGVLEFELQANLEGFVAGIDLSQVAGYV